VLVREPADLARTAWYADYLNPAPEAGGVEELNQVDRSLQTTRRFDALKLWATLRAVGADAIGEMVDAVCDLAAAVHVDLADDPELRVVSPTDLSTVLFRYQPRGVTAAQADALVARVRRVLFDSGRASVARTVVDGRPCLKLTLLNPTSTLSDVRRVLGLVRDVAHGILAGQALMDDAPPCRDVHPHLDRADDRPAAGEW
jgi:L-2,4-diaminobutyrate decarboxylase